MNVFAGELCLVARQHTLNHKIDMVACEFYKPPSYYMQFCMTTNICFACSLGMHR